MNFDLQSVGRRLESAATYQIFKCLAIRVGYTADWNNREKIDGAAPGLGLHVDLMEPERGDALRSSARAGADRMNRQKSPIGSTRFSSWHVGVAAEAAAAALFSRCGLDVSVQYGADQPEYDLIVASGEKMFKVSVKGSKDGSWGLTQSYLRKANYHGAIDTWLKRHKPKTIFCFVQFQGVPEDQMPRVYLATPLEVAERLRNTARRRGDTILYERHAWGPKAVGAGSIEQIPDTWKFSTARVEALLSEA